MPRYEFSEMNEDRDSGVLKGGGADRGCHVRLITGFVLVLLALVIALGAGLIVHFVENRKLECVYPEVVGNTGGDTNSQIGNPSTDQSPIMTTIMASSSPPIDFRLPNTFEPMEYVLRIQPNMYEGEPEGFTFSGRVDILIKCSAISNKVVLHINKLNVTSILFAQTSGTGTVPKYVSHDEDKDRQFLIVHLDRETTQGNTYTLTISFVGPLKNDMTGLYLTTYEQNGTTMYAATTQFEATDARKAFPCFDEPAMKATFKLTLVRKNYQMSLSNMPIINKREIADGFVEDIFQTSVKMSTYLLAYFIGEYVNTTRITQNNMTYSVWSRPEMRDQLSQSLDDGINILSHYEHYFNIKFPLPKQDMIAIPDFGAGAMENWGLITYRESLMLYDKDRSSAADKQEITATIAHEIGHEWFGDLVTMAWWDDLWLNEGFATFMEYFGTDYLYPDWKMLDQFVVVESHVVLDVDALKSSHPIYFSVNSPDEIDQVFDWISYNKGGAVIKMMKFVLGDETFRKGLHRYLNKMKYKNAFHDDLWEAFTQQASEDNLNINVTDFMNHWILQMNYPVVTAKRNVGSVTLEQRRFLMDEAIGGEDRPSPFGYKWKIPFTYTTSINPNFNVTNNDILWLTSEKADVPVNGLTDEDWFIGNLNEEGFYRVNYDDKNWKALIKQLKTKHTVIPTVNRAQIINDAWSLSKAGHLSTTIALQTLEYLKKETDYIPWMAALKQIHYVSDMLSKTGVYGKYKGFIKSLVNEAFKHYGLDEMNSTHLDSLTRDTLSRAACSYEVEACVAKSKNLFKQWMENPNNNPVGPNIKSAVFCSAIASGDIEEWEFLLDQLKQTNVPSDIPIMLKALGCSKKPWILNRYLEMTLNSSVIRKQDMAYALYGIASHPVGVVLAWDFVRDKWDYIFNKYAKGQISFRIVIPGLTKTFNTGAQLRQLENIVETQPDLGSGAREITQAIEKTKSNIKWMEQNEKLVSDWLSNVGVTTNARFTDVKLPRHLKPISYILTIKPNMYGDDPSEFTFEGSVKIVMKADGSGRNVTLHVNKLDIAEESIEFGRTDGQTSPKYKDRSSDKKRQFEILNLDGNMQKGKEYYIQMNFTGPLAPDLAGLYLSQYKSGNETIYMATTQFEATDARKTFPCFDEPDMKATFKVTLIRKPNIKTLFNMPLSAKKVLADGFVADEYKTTLKMSTYLLAFIFCDFDYKENHTDRGIQYRAWARPESVNQTDVALDTGVKIISFYEEYFNISFPLPKQEDHGKSDQHHGKIMEISWNFVEEDMIAIPDFSAGAMENWGLITYRETAMLYEPGVSSEHNKQYVKIAVSHELAHQWFGDLVTMNWWDDLWLNEGFATFVEYMGADRVSPDWKIFEQFVFELYDVFEVDDKVTSHPIYVPVYTPEEINEIFDTISYGKAGSVIRMMRFFLGEETFQKGLQIYLASRKFSNAGHNDLWAALQQQADSESKAIDVKDILDTWILQMNFPIVTITRNKPGEILVQQNRFLTDQNAKDTGRYKSPFDYVWKIPFTYTTQEIMNFNQTDKDVKWLNDRQTVIRDNTNGWILANIQQYGVYRVNYDDDNWKKLADQLKRNHSVIHFINRGQIINDAFRIAKAKMLRMEIALKTLEYLKNEEDYIPWTAAGGELGYISKMISDTKVYGQFQEFMVKTVTPLFNKLTMNFTGSGHIDIYLRSSIISKACGYGLEGCVEKSIELFNQYMQHPEFNPIDPEMKSTVYCTAVKHGGKKEWDFAFNLYMNAKVQAEKSRLLSTLSCTRKIWLLNKLLNLAMDESVVRLQDADYVFSGVGSNPVGKFVAWDFFRANFQRLYEAFGTGSFALSNIIRGISSAFNTEVQLQQLEEFQRANPDMGSGTRAFQQAIEATKNNIQWMKDNYNIFAKWLDEQR